MDRPPPYPQQRRRRCRGLVLAAVCAGLTTMAAAAPKGATHVVVIEAMQFSPAVLDIKAGDTVVWKNKDPFPHTATAAGGFDSKEIAAGRSWTFTVKKRGTFAYVCTLHPTMKASLTVK
jgi:plastocyanin